MRVFITLSLGQALCWNPCVSLGPVQVQTPEEPEPDLNRGSLMLRFRFAKFRELDLKSGFRFCPRTGPNRTTATLEMRKMQVARGLTHKLIQKFFWG